MPEGLRSPHIALPGAPLTPSHVNLPFPTEERTRESAPERAASSHNFALSCLFQNLRTGVPLLLTDGLAVCVGLVLSALATAMVTGNFAHLSGSEPQIFITGSVFIFVYALLGLYPGVAISPIVELKHMILGTLASGGILTFAMLAFGEPGITHWTFVIALTVSSLLVVPITRCLSRDLFSQFQWWAQPAIIVGSGSRAEQLRASLSQKVASGLTPVGIIHDRVDSTLVNRQSLGSLTQLESIARQHRVNWVLISVADESTANLNRILQHCGSIPNLIVMPQFDAFPSLWARTRNVGGNFGIYVRERLHSPTSQFCKRLFDLVAVTAGSVVLLPLVLPLLIATWALIQRYSPGSIFYSQERIGKGGKRFNTWKVRTMVHNGDQVLDQYLAENPDQKEIWDRTQKLQYDPRVIPGIGHFLRSTSLDELPQLWNVLTGDMSLVGPRPFIEYQESLYGDVLGLYQKVRPGITGLWQISGRNQTSFQERVKLDAYYVRNWSFWMDIFILGRTIRTVLRREGAF